MNKIEYLNYLSDKFKISKNILTQYISIVGTNEEDIENYAKSNSCAIARKQDGFDINYTAVMFNRKNKELEQQNQKIKVLERALEIAGEEHMKFGYCPDETCYARNNYGGNCKYCIKNNFIIQAEKEMDNE